MFYFFSGSYLSYTLSCCNAFTCFHAVSDSLLFTHTCPVTEFAVASHLNTANSCCHHVFLRHFRFQKYLPGNSNSITPRQEKGDVRRLCTRSPFSFSSISLLFYFCIASIRACTYSSSIFVVPSIPSRLLLIERS